MKEKDKSNRTSECAGVARFIRAGRLRPSSVGYFKAGSRLIRRQEYGNHGERPVITKYFGVS
jgi:hypothetical protein